MRIIIIFISFVSLAISQIPTNGLAGYWPLNGNAEDLSGTNNNGTIVPSLSMAPSTGKNNNLNSCYQFGSGYITTGLGYNNITRFSMSALFKTTTKAGGCIVGFSASSAGSGLLDRMIYMTNSGKLIFGIWGGSATTISSDSGFNDGLWHHVAATSDSGVIQFFVDGRKILFLTNKYPYVGIEYFRIGHMVIPTTWPTPPSSSFFEGLIDEVRLYSRALTDLEINNIANEVNITTNGLIGYWPLNGNADDLSTSNNDGTVVRLNRSLIPSSDRNNFPSSCFEFGSGYITTEKAYNNITRFSLSAFFKTTTTTGGCIMGFSEDATGSGLLDRMTYMTNAGKVLFGIWDGSGTIVSSDANCNDGLWHNVVATCDSGIIRLYIDGKSVSSLSGEYPYNGTEYFRIGHMEILSTWPTPPTSKYFNGSIDEVRLYTRALTESEVKNLFAASTKYEAGISKVDNDISIHVSPNPASGIISIKTMIPNGISGNITIYDINGRLIETIPHKASGINYLNWKPAVGNGVYFVKIETPTATRQQRISIVR